MLKLHLFVGLLLVGCNVLSQNLAAFHDYRRHFLVFDAGKVKDIEYLPVQSFQIGGICVPYVSNSGQFKVYYKGETLTLSERVVSKYIATRYLLVYLMYDQLYVFDNGKTTLLSSNVKKYAVGDSLVAFYNENTQSSHVYYKGKVIDLENSLIGNPIKGFRAGDNIFGYFNDNTKYFKIFYNGKLQNILKSNEDVIYEAGRNMIAYIDNSRNSFHVFYKGKVIDLEDYKPKSFQVGNDILAYVDNLGEFNVFMDGETKTISPFEPEIFTVKDSLVVFSEQGYFKVFYNGAVYELENYVPKDFQMQETTIAFIGLNGWLNAFSHGKYIKVTNDLVSSFVVTYNLIYINTTVNTIKIFYNGKLNDTN
jgi:hypothetical protein